MRNKLKIAAVVVGIVVGMVLYKGRFDKKEREEKAREDKKNAKQRWN